MRGRSSSANTLYCGFKDAKYPQFGSDLAEFLTLWKALFPRKKYLFNFRNKDDVLRSAWNIRRDGQKLLNSIVEFESAALAYSVEHREHALTVQYDAWAESEAERRKILDFLDVRFDYGQLQRVLAEPLLHGKSQKMP